MSDDTSSDPDSAGDLFSRPTITVSSRPGVTIHTKDGKESIDHE